MTLVVGIVSPKRAVFLSDGFALSQASRKVIRADARKLFVLHGGVLLAATGEAPGFRFAQELERDLAPWTVGAVWRTVCAWVGQHEDAQSSFFVCGPECGKLKTYATGRGPDGWLSQGSDPENPAWATVWADGFFQNRDEVNLRLSTIGRLDIFTFEQAVREAEKLFFEIRSQHPAEIGGSTFRVEMEASGEIRGPVEETARPEEETLAIRMATPNAASCMATTSLSNDGTTTAISVGSGTYHLGNISISANSGSVDPGSYGQWYVYFDTDSGYSGGSVTYHATSDKTVLTQSPYRVPVGGILTQSGGGGSSGGTGAGGGNPILTL